jgi:hypothetical protein
MSNILTKADIVAYAPELDLSSYSDATISGMISAATERAAEFCNVTGFDFTSVVNETDNAVISVAGDLLISVRRRPIVTVSAIGLVKGGFSTSLTLTGTDGTPYYQIPYPNTKIVLPNSYLYGTGTMLAGGSSNLMSLRGSRVMYQISYTGGYQNPPDSLKYAIALYFRDSFTKQFNTQGLSSFTQGSYSESYGAGGSKGRSALVQEAESVLRSGGYARIEF